MQYLKMTLICVLIALLGGTGAVQAFSFDFGDDDDYYYHPYWRPYYQPWASYFPPQLPSFDRSAMVRERQQLMDNHMDAMTRLRELLYGKHGFDRAEAIQLARKIELTSGIALTRNFHPGAVREFDSRTTPAFWGNEQTFKANAQALQAAAKDLATELEKQPAAGEGTVYLPKRWTADGEDKAAVSAAIWEKYNTLSNTCESCHRSFRGSRW
jgi:cytochrome c556